MSGGAQRSAWAGVLALTALASLCVAAAPAQPEAERITNDIAFRLGGDGTVQTREEIAFEGEVPETFERTFVTREHYDDTDDRVFEIGRIHAQSGDAEPVEAEARDSDEGLVIEIDTGALSETADPVVILEYEVRGATTRVGEATEFAWYAVGGYSATVADTTVVVDAPLAPLALSCAAGDPRSSIYCTSSDMGGPEALFARFTQAQLQPGETLRIAVNYPQGAVEEQLLLDRRFSFTSAFKVTPATLGVFLAVVLILVGGLVALVYARGRDERMTQRESAIDSGRAVIESDGEAVFRPPDGVRPAQIGTLIDEQADVVDVTASVVDLAVRGHLEIEELPHGRFAAQDWLLHRKTPHQDEALRAYEVVLLDALFTGRDEVRVSELGGELARVLPRVRAELYRDMVRLRWFVRRPNRERNRWAGVGVAITVGGLLLTVLLAMFTQAAFTGLAVIIAGAAITIGSQYAPSKTARGSEVLAHTLAFRNWLFDRESRNVPDHRRVDLFSRYLPYAIIFDMVDTWASVLASAGAEELEYDDLPWYHAPEEWRLADFTDSIKNFTRTLSGVISNTRQLQGSTR